MRCGSQGPRRRVGMLTLSGPPSCLCDVLKCEEKLEQEKQGKGDCSVALMAAPRGSCYTILNKVQLGSGDKPAQFNPRADL